MNNRLNHYTIIGPDFFQELEEEFGVKITEKRAIFLMTVKIVRPDRFMTSEMKWCGVGRKKLDREKFFRAFLLKAEFNLSTTKVLIMQAYEFVFSFLFWNQMDVSAEDTFL